MKVWITKHALTQGIYEKDGDVCEGTDGKMIVVNPTDLRVGFTELFHRPDWHTDRRLAVIRAHEMLLKKIQSLKKQVTRLEKLDFLSDTKN